MENYGVFSPWILPGLPTSLTRVKKFVLITIHCLLLAKNRVCSYVTDGWSAGGEDALPVSVCALPGRERLAEGGPTDAGWYSFQQ